MPVTQKRSIKRYYHTAATVLVTEDVSEVVLFGGLRSVTITETTILRLGKLCPTSNLCHSYFGNSNVIKVIILVKFLVLILSGFSISSTSVRLPELFHDVIIVCTLENAEH